MNKKYYLNGAESFKKSVNVYLFLIGLAGILIQLISIKSVVNVSSDNIWSNTAIEIITSTVMFIFITVLIVVFLRRLSVFKIGFTKNNKKQK